MPDNPFFAFKTVDVLTPYLSNQMSKKFGHGEVSFCLYYENNWFNNPLKSRKSKSR